MTYGVSNTADAVNSVFLFIFTACVFLLALITFLMIFFAIKYHHTRNRKAENIKENLPLEITWTVIPTLLVLVMFFYGVAGFNIMRRGPANSFQIKVTARMWSWLFTYKNGIESDVLRLPEGEPIKVVLTSQDVIHGFYIPAFRIKQDAVPGRENYLYFVPQKAGTYDLLCTQFCGLRHSYMQAKVEVMPREDFYKWYAANKPTPKPVVAAGKSPVAEGALAARGAQLVKLKGCTVCHTIDGTVKVGPSWKGLYGHQVTVLTNGQEHAVTAEEAYLRRSILEPAADLTKGFQNLMPPQKLSEEEIAAVIAYIKGIK